MSKYIDENREWMDILSERVRESAVQPSEELWARVESSVRAQDAAVVASGSRGLWLWVGGVAALLAAALLTPHLMHTSDALEGVESSAPIIAEVVADSVGSTPPLAQLEAASEVGDVQVKAVISKPSSSSEGVASHELIEMGGGDTAAVVEPVKDAASDEKPRAEAPERVKERVKERGRGASYAAAHEAEVRRSQLKFSLFGSGDYLAHINAAQAGYRHKDAAYNVLINPGADPDSHDDTYKYYDAIHHQPLSLGARAQLELMPRLRLASGLTFTRLVSDIRLNPNSSLFDTEQKVYYVGVPLRLDYDLVSTGDFSLYVGAGGAVDYCLGATIGGKRAKENRWHYSINLALGAEHRFTNRLGLYIEPEFSHHLTPTRLNSVRGDNSASLTLRCGLSFTL